MDGEGLLPIEVVEPDDEPPVGAEVTIARLMRRQRLLTALLVVAALGGAVVGAAVERDGVTGDAGLRAASDQLTATTPSTDDAVDGGGDGGRSAPLLEDGVSREAFASDEMGGGFYPDPALTWIGSAALGDLDVRLLLAEYGPPDDGNPFWDAPPGCSATGAWSIQVSTARFVSVLSAERLGMPDRPDGTVQLVGVAEGDPRWVAIAAVDPASATFTMPDGTIVPATDVGGMAVASAPAPGWAEAAQHETGFRATLDAAGRTSEILTWWYPDETFHTENCQPPPPTLPEPGEQPADPAGAREEVHGALTTVFGNPDPDAKAAVVEHPDVVLPAMEAVAVNYPDISAEAELVELVFTAPGTAFFRFHLDADIAMFQDQIGEARLVGGRWVITTETICTQLRRGGATCEAPA